MGGKLRELLVNTVLVFFALCLLIFFSLDIEAVRHKQL